MERESIMSQLYLNCCLIQWNKYGLLHVACICLFVEKCSFLFGRITGVAWKSKKGKDQWKGSVKNFFKSWAQGVLLCGASNVVCPPSSYKIQLYVPLWGVAASKRRNKASLAQTLVISWKLYQNSKNKAASASLEKNEVGQG